MTVTVTRPRPEVAQITLDRPERLNAMTAELVTGLHAALDELHGDPACRVIVLTGAGRAFCAGLDLDGYGTPPGSEQRHGPAASMAVQEHIASLVTHLRATRQPVVAAVNGAAAGGGLALVCASDVRLAASTARFAVSFVRVGLSGCDIGTSWLLPRLVGAGRAHELMLTGRLFDAAEAERIGLVTSVVPDAELLEAAYREAELILGNAPFGVEMTKQTMWAALEAPSLPAAVALENRTQVLCLGGDDFAEAVAAFRGRRPPRWAPAARG